MADIDQLPKRLTVRRLYYLHLAVRHRRADTAAEEAGVSVQAFHDAMGKVNQEFDVPLWQANNGRITPTARGRQFCQWLEPFMEQLPGQIAAVNRGANGQVVLGATQPIISHYGALILRQFRQRFSGQELVFVDKGNSPKALMLAVKHLEVDVALAPREFRMPELSEEEVGRCKHALVIGKNHPLARQETISLEQLSHVPMIRYHQEMGIQTLVNTIFDRWRPTCIAEAGTSDAALQYALETGAFAIVYEPTAALYGSDLLRCYSLEHLPAEMQPPVTLCLYTRANLELDKSVKEFCRVLVDVGQEILAGLKLNYDGCLVE